MITIFHSQNNLNSFSKFTCFCLHCFTVFELWRGKETNFTQESKIVFERGLSNFFKYYYVAKIAFQTKFELTFVKVSRKDTPNFLFRKTILLEPFRSDSTESKQVTWTHHSREDISRSDTKMCRFGSVGAAV